MRGGGGLLALDLDALEIELLPLLELGDLGVRGTRVCVDRGEAGSSTTEPRTK
jgi:hypothetical protein